MHASVELQVLGDGPTIELHASVEILERQAEQDTNRHEVEGLGGNDLEQAVAALTPPSADEVHVLAVHELVANVLAQLGHALLQRKGLAVARVALAHVAVRNDARWHVAALGGMRQPLVHAGVVADVAVAEAQRMQGRIGQLAHGVDHALRHGAAGARIDDDQAGVGLGHEGLALAAQDVQARRHGLGAGADDQEGFFGCRGIHGASFTGVTAGSAYRPSSSSARGT